MTPSDTNKTDNTEIEARVRQLQEAEVSISEFIDYLETIITQRCIEARIDELKKLKAMHSRTYRQTITDSAGNIYLNDSHGYISSYETQERIAALSKEADK